MDTIDDSLPLGKDLLQGAMQIAEFLFGDEKRSSVRKVYYLAESGQLPVFRLSKSSICARRSTIERWIAAQEAKPLTGEAL